MTSASKILTTAAKMALCVIIQRDRLIALVNVDLPEMDTIAQVSILAWQERCEEQKLLYTINRDWASRKMGVR